MSANILLEEEQKELLKTLAEAAGNVSKDERQPFFAFKAMARVEYEISHPGLAGGKIMAYQGDYEALIKENLIWVDGHTFEVSPLGFQFYREKLK